MGQHIGEIRHDRRAGALAADEGAGAGAALDQPVRGELVERAAHRDARDAVLDGQHRLARQARMRPVLAREDAIPQEKVEPARLQGFDARHRAPRLPQL